MKFSNRSRSGREAAPSSRRYIGIRGSFKTDKNPDGKFTYYTVLFRDGDGKVKRLLAFHGSEIGAMIPESEKALEKFQLGEEEIVIECCFPAAFYKSTRDERVVDKHFDGITSIMVITGTENVITKRVKS